MLKNSFAVDQVKHHTCKVALDKCLTVLHYMIAKDMPFQGSHTGASLQEKLMHFAFKCAQKRPAWQGKLCYGQHQKRCDYHTCMCQL